jgi:hypothetical protein
MSAFNPFVRKTVRLLAQTDLGELADFKDEKMWLSFDIVVDLLRRRGVIPLI